MFCSFILAFVGFLYWALQQWLYPPKFFREKRVVFLRNEKKNLGKLLITVEMG